MSLKAVGGRSVAAQIRKLQGQAQSREQEMRVKLLEQERYNRTLNKSLGEQNASVLNPAEISLLRFLQKGLQIIKPKKP